MIWFISGISCSSRDLKCDFETISNLYLWPIFVECQVDDIDLSLQYKKDVLIFADTVEEKNKTDIFKFYRSPQVDYIPLEILREFPNLNGFRIWSNIPILKDDLFSNEFEIIEYLDLNWCQLRTIQRNVFQFLIKLKYIDLNGNFIQTLQENIFENNQRLEYVGLWRNKITFIDPKFFYNLKTLKKVDLKENDCIDEEFVCEDCVLDNQLLKRKFLKCFSNSGGNSIQLNCKFTKNSFHYNLLPKKEEQCEISDIIIKSNEFPMENLTFGGTISKKNSTYFLNLNHFSVSDVNFLSLKIFEEFPSLVGINISWSNTELLKSHFLSADYKSLEYLDLSHCNIKDIESNAFQNLEGLRWINLEANEIETLQRIVFQNNQKLEYINLNSNGVIEINENFFTHLHYLKFVQLSENLCVSKIFGCINCQIDLEELHKGLLHCFDTNYPKVNCQYGQFKKRLWEEVKYCKVENVDLQSMEKNKTLIFTGTVKRKNQVTAIEFSQSMEVDFLPQEILQQFPHLNGLLISQSFMPVLRKDIITIEFSTICYLSLQNNSIYAIVQQAFDYLTDLKWIDLSYNALYSLKGATFKNNKNLEYIKLSSNKIKAVNPLFFENLVHLKFIDMEDNRCVNQKFGCVECLVNHFELHLILSICYSNCAEDHECSSKASTPTTSYATIARKTVTNKMKFSSPETPKIPSVDTPARYLQGKNS